MHLSDAAVSVEDTCTQLKKTTSYVANECVNGKKTLVYSRPGIFWRISVDENKPH